MIWATNKTILTNKLCLISILLTFFILTACSSKEELHIGPIQHFNRGYEYFQQKNFRKALDEYQAAIALDSKEPTFYYHEGRVYYELQLYKKAIESFLQALQLNPNYAEVWHDIALAYDKIDDIDNAFIANERYLKLSR